jgi:hypothetical protein
MVICFVSPYLPSWTPFNMISNLKFSLAFLSLLFPLFVFAQYPTAVGTKWEYYQFREDLMVPQDMITTWQDEVVGDTVAAGNTYQIVRRTGALYHGFGAIVSMHFETLEGTFYTRVVGTQVWVLDSVVLGNAEESLLYEFGIPATGLLPEPLKNVVNLTPAGLVPFSHAERFNNEVICGSSLCDSIFSLYQRPANLPFWPACSTWLSTYANLYLPDVGTIFSHPFITVLDQYGEAYYLRSLTSNGQTLYITPLLMTALEPTADDFFLLSPNPAMDQVNVAATVPLHSLKLLDATGRMVLEKGCDGVAMEATLDVAALPRGLYWLVAEGESQRATQAVVLR